MWASNSYGTSSGSITLTVVDPPTYYAQAVGAGPVETDGFNAISTAEMKQLFISRTPLGRLGTPSDIADVVAFLASPDARWVTGQVLLVNGGFTTL